MAWYRRGIHRHRVIPILDIQLKGGGPFDRTGFIVANSIAGALSIFPERAGAVSALIGAIQYGTGIIGSALVGVLLDHRVGVRR